MKNGTNLILDIFGEVVSKSINNLSYPRPLVNSLNCYDFYFDGVTDKTSNTCKYDKCDRYNDMTFSILPVVHCHAFCM